MTATKEKFFNPAKLSAQDKAAATDQTARAIIAAEMSAREKKTEKLRMLRLQRAADAEPETAAPAKKRQRPTKTLRSRQSR
jgi:hypothetical protein